MEELDLLRADWKKNEKKFARIPRSELYGMLHKKSSSIVKWILIISILEIVLWLVLSFAFDGEEGPGSGAEVMDNLNIDPILYAMTIGSYGILIFFCFIIYRNYKRIKITDNAKNLMANILRVRKAVSYYIYINLGFITANSLFIFFEYFHKDADMVALFSRAATNGKLLILGFIAFAVTLLVIAVFAGIVWLYYRIIYGFLLRKLYRNYEELKKIDE